MSGVIQIFDIIRSQQFIDEGLNVLTRYRTGPRHLRNRLRSAHDHTLQHSPHSAGNIASFMQGGDAGAVVLVAGAGILDSSDHAPAAERFIMFLLSTDAQQFFSDETFEYPLVEGVEPQAGLIPLDDIEVPDLDLSSLSDLEGTLDMLRDAGVIP